MRLRILKSYGRPDSKKARRRLKNAKITHVSLVKRGRNKMPVVMKSGGRFELETIVKAQGDLLHALVYVPERADTDGDVASREEVRKMAHAFLSNGGNIDIEHDLQPLGPEKVQIAETFVVQKGDPRFDGMLDYQGDPVDAEGSWAMILKLLDPGLKSAAARGELNGVSMFGHAEVEQLAKEDTADEQLTEDDEPMKPEEIQQIVEATTAAVVKAIKPPEAAPKPATPETPKAPERVKPVFKGDPRDTKALAKFQEECLLASLDLSDSEDMATWQAHLVKVQKAEGKDGEGSENENEGGEAGELRQQIAALNARLDKVSKSSAVPAGSGKGDEKDADPKLTGLKKGEGEPYARGRSIAAQINKRNGRA